MGLLHIRAFRLVSLECVVLVLQKLKQEDDQFKASLGILVCFSVAVIHSTDQKQFREERVYLFLFSHNLLPHI